jgi:hypothetical protein
MKMKKPSSYRKSDEIPANCASQSPVEPKREPTKPAELPPNENIQKDPDEIYGDRKSRKAIAESRTKRNEHRHAAGAFGAEANLLTINKT